LIDFFIYLLADCCVGTRVSSIIAYKVFHVHAQNVSLTNGFIGL